MARSSPAGSPTTKRRLASKAEAKRLGCHHAWGGPEAGRVWSVNHVRGGRIS